MRKQITTQNKKETILIFNGKGGIGKTSIAGNLGMTFDLKIQTNDISTLVLHKDRCKYTKKLVYEEGTIYDCGGFVAANILKLVAKVDLVIVPVNYSYDDSPLAQTIHTLKQLLPVAKKILIVTTQTEGKEAVAIQKELDKKFDYLKYINLPKTKALAYAIKKKKSLKELIDSSDKYKKWFESFYKGSYTNLINSIKKELSDG